MSQVTIKSVGKKLQVWIDGKPVNDVVGFKLNGNQGEPSTVDLTIKAESVAVVTEAKEVKKSDLKVKLPPPPKNVLVNEASDRRTTKETA